MKNTINLWCAVTLVAMVMLSCGGGSNTNYEDTPAKGEITVAVDESFQPVIAAEKSAFEQTYKYTKINLVYKPDLEAVTMLLNSKARMAVVARELTDTEKKVFDEEKIKYRSYKFAQDALALITNKANKDTMITTQELGAIMKGEKKKWSEVGKRGANEEIVLVFDNASSSNLVYLMQKYGIDKKDKISFFAMKSNKEVISYVKSHNNALGVIGVNWISDGDDPATLSFIKGINVMAVAEKANPTNEDYYQPFGYNVALKKYPLLREIKLILKEAHLGLGTGFLNYMCMDQGQLIAYKQGLIPLTRSVNIRMVKMGE